jgi:hypothetical protein
MSNLFSDALNDPQGLQERLLGPAYSYSDGIKTPAELGMSKKGTIKALGKDIDGLTEYVQLLVSGDSKASKTGGPLGNKFFLQTGGKCKDKVSDQEVDRYIYINNVPQGNIPFISSAGDMNFKDLRGLIPGTMGNLNAFNPFSILGAFMAGATPECQEVTLQTIDTNNNKSTETHYVTTVDLKNMDACSFKDKTNPVTNQKCKETFTPMTASSTLINHRCPNIEEDDLFTKAYFASLGVVGIYVFYRLMIKNNNQFSFSKK